MKFEWDVHKERINIQKHGITFEEASYVFADPFALNKYDDDHSHDEDRWVIIGKSLREIIIVVVHTIKCDDKINHNCQKGHKDGTAGISTTVLKMKDEYDFTDAEQGKFYRPIEELDIPIYLDKEVKNFFIVKCAIKKKIFP